MKHRTLLVLLFILSGTIAANAQVSLTATSGTTSGSYTTLKGAFDAINAGTHHGKIIITLSANTTETSSAVLNASGTGSSGFDSIRIYPTVTGLTIGGNLNRPLIDLSGADYVTFDGRLNSAGLDVDLCISNSSTAGDNATSTIRFINAACNNTVKYCKLKGSTWDGASGILCFFTSSGPTGNNNNLIDHNQITNANGIPPYNGLFSNGSSGYPNSSNTISNNNIYDVWNIQWTSTYAINLSLNNDGGNAYNSGWTISGNSFYLTTEYIPTDKAGGNFCFIYINASAGTGFTISNNYIGGNAPLCGGTFTKTQGNNSFNGISLNAATGTASNIQGNTIKNINYTNTGDYSWVGIGVGSGDVNIGTTAGNCIGSSSGTGSITFTANGWYYPNFKGIWIGSTGNVQIQNNSIGSVTTNNNDSQWANSIYGIYLQTNNSGNYSVSNNTIGSATTANSINATSSSTINDGAATQMVAGIMTEGNATTLSISISNNTIANLTNGTTNSNTNINGWIYGLAIFRSTNTLSGNCIHDLTIANANTNSGPVPNVDWRTSSLSAAGISVSVPSSSAQTVTGNTVYNISNSNSSFAGHVAGIYFAVQSTASSVSKNLIYGLNVNSSSSSATIHGIKIAQGVATYSNNIVNLGGNTSTSLYGIYEAGASSTTSNINFNTVYIAGSPTSGSLNSACLYNAGNSSTRDFRDNVFFNARSNNGANGKHYSMYIQNTGGNLTCDYNDYWVTGTGGTLGYYGGEKTSLPIVSGATGNDVHSLTLNPSFASAGGTSATDYIPSTAMTAVSISGITTDYGGTTRSGSPEMGAWEQGNTVTWNSHSSKAWDIAANWNPQVVPTASHNIIVPDGTEDLEVNQSIATPAMCNNLTIQSGAKVVILPGKALTVNGTLTNSGGVTRLVIQSDATGTGSLIQSSSSVGATVQRFISGSATPTSANAHFVSIPVNVASPTSNLFLGSYLYKMDPTQVDPTNNNYYGLWVNLGSSTTTPLSCNAGYMVYYPATEHTYTFTGTLNTGTFSPTVSYGTTYTFNLVPNPYPSAINWGSSGGWVKSNIGATAWIWNPTGGNYTTLSGPSYVPAGQAFIVMASGSPVLTVNNNACVHNTQAFYKSNEANKLKISAASNNYYDEAFVEFNSSASSSFDPDYDGFKLWGLEDAPQLWTEKGDDKLSVNQLPLPSGALTVPLDFKTSVTGAVVLSVSGVESFDPSLAIRLQDHVNGSWTDLRQKSTYTFTHDTSNTEKRFSIVFGYPAGVNDHNTSEGKAFISSGRIYLDIPSMQGRLATVTVYDMLGQVIRSQELKIDGGSVEAPVAKGVYVVAVSSDGKNFVTKVINK